MQAIIIVSALVVVSSASPAIFGAQSNVRSQYHSQNGNGEYNYGYNSDLSAKVESRSLDGVTRGSYNYVDANGQLQTVEYQADDANGFRVLSTNLPRSPIHNVNVAGPVPVQVQDTPEVQHAKIEHARLFNEAAQLAAASPENSIHAAIPQFAPQQAFAVRNIEAPSSFSYSTSIDGNSLPLLNVQRGFFGHQSPIASSLNDGPVDEPAVQALKADHLRAVQAQKALLGL